MNLELLTAQVCEIARQAGEYIKKEREGFCADKIERKHAHDYVSYVDKGSERLIVKGLRRLLPSAGFVTEEGTAAAETAASGAPPASVDEGASADGLVWVVDPLDGTTNFIHGYAPYAVSIALIDGQSVLSGVVYEVCADECYYAWQGGGAHLEMRNEKGESRSVTLHVSNCGLNDALLCLQLPYNSDAYKPVINRLVSHFYGRVGSIRMIGSAAMALCYVAAGRLDAYAERYIGQWDFMAGALIVTEAGGTVADYNGDGRFMYGDSIVASNGIVHQQLLDVICTTI
jgi:myo-inositol-1(or 4)-monophosphatase